MTAPYFPPCLFALVIIKGQAVLIHTLSVAKVNYGLPIHSVANHMLKEPLMWSTRQGAGGRSGGGVHIEKVENQPFGASKMI